jgi:hypothetical protein
VSWSDEDGQDEAQPGDRPVRETELQDKVHELNQAIEDVRRQLETMNPQN